MAYFSATNTTKVVAEHIANGLAAELYEIVPEEPYTDADLDYNDDNSRSTIAFLEEYDFSGKTIIPFCSHGGGQFGQSLTAIAKLVPDARMGEALSVHYSGGSDLPDEITKWLKINGIIK